ncbi:MAG: YkgJ family cysteine cluster protein [Candidatus Obscuribacterales bacterium]|nr:YkgJ family cysteine cluster protein [Candidatus Obscuribacterales bacterium]
MQSKSQQLHIPKGIRFSCSECGNCCLQWPVPATTDDFERIESARSKLGGDFPASRDLFRVLNAADSKLSVFSHSLEKRADGKCAFLSEENRCVLHEKVGPEAKPAMCRLFPYTFTGTPDGVFCSVSFASTATLFNQGDLLEQQGELLEQKHDLFSNLFPQLNLDWSYAQVVDGVPLQWSVYREHEAPVLTCLEQESARRADALLFEKTEAFRKLVPPEVNLDNMADFEARPKLIDQVLIKHLLRFYVPVDVFGETSMDFQARAVLEEVIRGSEKVEIIWNSKAIGFGQIFSCDFSDFSDECRDLIRRFLYLRVFSKLYFGPGFNYLSVVAGFHHLITVAVLARLCLKLDLISGLLTREELATQKAFLRMAEHLRCIERRLTVADFSEETIAMLEILLASPRRIERLISLSA